jgi:hypothetical protein
MRTVIRSTIADDLGLRQLGVVPDAVYAGDIDTPPERPFIQLRWGGTAPGVGAVGVRQLAVWVHDAPNDYTRIDGILRRVRFLMSSLVGVVHDSGWLTQVDWNTDSDDLSDDGHGTITRNSTYTVVGSGY